jgi:CRISPR-associated endoribonuclease Cas6
MESSLPFQICSFPVCPYAIKFYAPPLLQRVNGQGDHSWVDWERYSNRQETKMKMGGFIGSITFEGELEPFLQFLVLGEYIHVGKERALALENIK